MTEMKFGTRIAQGVRMMPKRRIHTAQRKCTIPVPHSTMINMTRVVVKALWMMKNMTYVIVTALYNQPEAFASDLGDQSR